MIASQEHAKQLASRLIKEQFGTELSDFELIEVRGEVNQVYMVATAQYKAVLRINSPDELSRYLKEQWCMDAVRSTGVATPKLLCVGSDKQCAYTLLEFIPGANGKAIADTNDLWHALGKSLRLIHSISVTGFGDTLDAIVSGNAARWQQYIKDNIDALANGSLTESLGLNASQTDTLQDQLTSLLAKDFTFGLNHGDYSLANTIVSDQGVPYIIDWGSAQAHIVPHHDLAVILEESLEEDSQKYASLLSGYQIVRQGYEVISDEIKLLQLLDALDKVRWAMDKAPQRIEHHLERFGRFARKNRKWLLHP